MSAAASRQTYHDLGLAVETATNNSEQDPNGWSDTSCYSLDRRDEAGRCLIKRRRADRVLYDFAAIKT